MGNYIYTKVPNKIIKIITNFEAILRFQFYRLSQSLLESRKISTKKQIISVIIFLIYLPTAYATS